MGDCSVVALFDIPGAGVMVARDIRTSPAGKLHLKPKPLSVRPDPEKIKTLSSVGRVFTAFFRIPSITSFSTSAFIVTQEPFPFVTS
jgi:hypothetical protein